MIRKAGQATGVHDFLAGTTDYAKIGNAANINTAKEHAQSFDNNRQTAGAGMIGMQQVTNADRQADAIGAESSAQAQSTWAQAGASAVGSLGSVFGSMGGGGGSAGTASIGNWGGSGAASPTQRIDFGSAWSSGVG